MTYDSLRSVISVKSLRTFAMIALMSNTACGQKGPLYLPDSRVVNDIEGLKELKKKQLLEKQLETKKPTPTDTNDSNGKSGTVN